MVGNSPTMEVVAKTPLTLEVTTPEIYVRVWEVIMAEVAVEPPKFEVKTLPLAPRVFAVCKFVIVALVAVKFSVLVLEAVKFVVKISVKKAEIARKVLVKKLLEVAFVKLALVALRLVIWAVVMVALPKIGVSVKM